MGGKVRWLPEVGAHRASAVGCSRTDGPSARLGERSWQRPVRHRGFVQPRAAASDDPQSDPRRGLTRDPAAAHDDRSDGAGLLLSALASPSLLPVQPSERRWLCFVSWLSWIEISSPTGHSPGSTEPVGRSLNTGEDHEGSWPESAVQSGHRPVPRRQPPVRLRVRSFSRADPLPSLARCQVLSSALALTSLSPRIPSPTTRSTK